MRRIRTTSALVAVLALSPAGLFAQESFEGTVAYAMTMGEMNIDMVHHVKGDRMRQEISDLGGMGQMVMLLDVGKMEVNMIIPAQRAYMTMDLKQVAEMAKQQQGDAEPDIDIERTGQTDRVAGHACENIIMRTDDVSVRMCVASDLGFYFMGGSNAASTMGGVGAPGLVSAAETRVREMFGDGFFPLSVTMTQNGQTITMVATSIERKSVSDDLFTVPAGYTKLPGMGGFGGG